MNHESSYYIVDGSEYPLQRQPSARLIVPANDDRRHLATRLSRSSQLELATTVPNPYLLVYGDAVDLDEIRYDSDVHCTRSAFMDSSGHELVLTNDILVRFAPTMEDTNRRDLCRQFNCTVIDDSREIWCLRVLDTDDDAPLNLANHLCTEPGVEFAEPNALQTATPPAETAPGEARCDPQWYLPNSSQAGVTFGADVRARAFWDISATSPDVDNPDFSPTIGPRRDFNHDDTDTANYLTLYGTTGIGVTTAGRNTQELVDIAPGCRIVPLRAAGAHTWLVWAETFEWAAYHGDIISCSWILSPSNIVSEAIRHAARDGRNGRGTLIFCATGYDRHGVISYPSSLPTTIAVLARPNPDRRADDHPYGRGIDFVEPSRDDASPTTPLAAEVAALMLRTNQNLTADEVRAIMRDTCNPIDAAHAHYNERGWSFEYGYGQVNAAAALRRAQELGPQELEIQELRPPELSNK